MPATTKSPIEHRDAHFADDMQALRLNSRSDHMKAVLRPTADELNRDDWIAQQIEGFKGDVAQAESVRWKKQPLLTAAVAAQREDWVAQVLSWELSLELIDDLHRTALHYAVQYESTGIVQRLIAAGANLQAQDGNHNTPLHIAAQVNWEKHVALLIESGANMEAVTLLDKSTPLIDAARMSLESAQVLLEKGANVHAQSKHGETPLIAALAGGNPKAVPVLIDAGADVNHVDAQGWPVLWHALRRTEDLKNPDHNSVNLLLAAHANPRMELPQGKTLMHVAAEHGRLDHLTTLIAMGVPALVEDVDGITPLDLLNTHHPRLAEPFRQRVLEQELPAPAPRRPGPRF